MIKKFLTSLIIASFILSNSAPVFAQNTDKPLKIFKLNNGQTVIIKEVHASPIVTVDTWVKTGSINENNKNNGVSHFLEHLIFKGTKIHKVGEIDKILESKGAEFNAATSKDFTHFYITIPSQHINTAIKLHSDMLLNAQIPEAELKRERKVVQEEIRRSEDTPDRQVFKNLNKQLFKHHPYKYETLGTTQIIETIPRKSILNYYHKWYIPANMTTMVVGDISTEKALALVSSNFKTSNLKKPISVKYVREPFITKPSVKIQKGHYNTGYMLVGYKGVPITDKKANYALDIASAILGGGQSSRLYQDIKEKQKLVTNISAGHYSLKDDSIFYVSANFSPSNYALVKKAIIKQIDLLRNGNISPEELQRAKTQFQRQFLYSNESIENIANSIGYNMTISGNIDSYTKYIDEINKITIEDVQTAAAKYLSPSKSAVSILIPENTVCKTKQIINVSDNIQHIKNQESYKDVIKYNLNNGITLLTNKNTHNQIISLSLFVKGGKLVEPAAGINDLVALTLMKGTKSRTALEISKDLENSGIRISPSSNPDYFEIQLKSTVKDFDKAFNILADIVNNPAFNNEFISKAKSDIIESIKESRDVPSSLAIEKLVRMIYPNHPYGKVGELVEKSISSISRNDIINYYDQVFIPQNMVISVSGNIDRANLVKKFANAFPSNKKGTKINTESLKSSYEPLSINKYWMIPKNTSAAAIFLGWKADSMRNNKDFASLKLLSTILGGGMTSRLFVNLREKQGLAYTVSASYPTRIDDSFFSLYIGTNPVNAPTAINGFFNEIKTIKTVPVSEKELNDAKQKLLGQYLLAQETNQQKAHNIGAFETLGKGYKFNWQFVDLINSINCGDIINAANKYFNTPYALSVVAPQKNIEAIEKELSSESKR